MLPRFQLAVPHAPLPVRLLRFLQVMHQGHRRDVRRLFPLPQRRACPKLQRPRPHRRPPLPTRLRQPIRLHHLHRQPQHQVAPSKVVHLWALTEGHLHPLLLRTVPQNRMDRGSKSPPRGSHLPSKKNSRLLVDFLPIILRIRYGNIPVGVVRQCL